MRNSPHFLEQAGAPMPRRLQHALDLEGVPEGLGIPLLGGHAQL